MFTYDSGNRPISRKEAFIAGKIKQNQRMFNLLLLAIYQNDIKDIYIHK